jgi:hypothetical protein
MNARTAAILCFVELGNVNFTNPLIRVSWRPAKYNGDNKICRPGYTQFIIRANSCLTLAKYMRLKGVCPPADLLQKILVTFSSACLRSKKKAGPSGPAPCYALAKLISEAHVYGIHAFFSTLSLICHNVVLADLVH